MVCVKHLIAHFYRLAFLALCFASFVTAKEFFGWLVGELVPEENNCIVGALLLFLVWQLVYKAFKRIKMRHEGKD